MGEGGLLRLWQRWYMEHMFDIRSPPRHFLEALYESCGDDPEVAELVARMFSHPLSLPARPAPPPQDGAGRQGG